MSDQVAQVITLITDTVLCQICIAEKAGMPTDDVYIALRTTVRVVQLRVEQRLCDGCFRNKTTFSVTRNGQP